MYKICLTEFTESNNIFGINLKTYHSIFNYKILLENLFFMQK